MKVTSSSPVARAIGTAALWLTLALSPAAIGAQESESDERNESGGLPLSADRSIPIDMSEGSWISLDVSPDGETIVFDYLGNLFTIPIGGGKATQLTSGLAFDAQPRFSPDGARIVYTSDRDGGQNDGHLQPLRRGLDGGGPGELGPGRPVDPADCLKHGVQPRVLTLHSDRGAPMTSQCTAQLLAD